jgi:hypothetical protein
MASSNTRAFHCPSKKQLAATLTVPASYPFDTFPVRYDCREAACVGATVTDSADTSVFVENT